MFKSLMEMAELDNNSAGFQEYLHECDKSLL